MLNIVGTTEEFVKYKYISELFPQGIKSIYPLTSIPHLVKDCALRHEFPHTSELIMGMASGLFTGSHMNDIKRPKQEARDSQCKFEER